MPRSCPPEFRRKVLDLVESGRKVAEVAQLLGISEQTIYVWRRQRLIDSGQLPGTTTAEMPNWPPDDGGSPSWKRR
jgi:transposase-like protein